jgi:hypothetical protein
MSAALVLVLAGLGLMALPASESQDSRRELTRGALRATPISTKPSNPFLTKSIEQIRVGDRVLADNPERPRSAADSLEEIDPQHWRLVEMVMPPRDGRGEIGVTLLRPLEWIDGSGAGRDRFIRLAMPELGAIGPARVAAIRPCPPIAVGTGQVVIGTFAHQDADVLDLRVNGLDEPLGVTAIHPIFSVDRSAFIPAGELRIGERLKTPGGTTILSSLLPRLGKHRVYNLEVHVEHVFNVTSLGVLVHNAKPCFINCFTPGTNVLMADGSTRAIEDIAPGELVLASDPESSRQASPHRVVGRIENWTRRVVHVGVAHGSDGGTIDTTGEHPFWTDNRGWTRAIDLQVGDTLRDATGDSVSIVDVWAEPRESKTYNLSVQGVHTFFVVAGGVPVLVHNMDPWTIKFSRPVMPGETFAHGPWAGQTVEAAIAEAMKLGRLPDGLTLEAQMVGNDMVAANNRTLYVARQANLANVSPVDNGGKTFKVIEAHFRKNGFGGPVPEPCP